jgi:hypothetical protein
VTDFRTLTSLVNPQYVDTTTALTPHDDVTLSTPGGVPTLTVKQPVSLEIGLASSDTNESYRPLAVYFRQKTDAATVNLDPDGLINFTQSLTAIGTIVIHHSCKLRGHDGHYEFFVLIQRVSDSAIGLIDPEIETENQE